MNDHAPPEMEISRHAARRWAERVRQDRSIGPRNARTDMQRCAPFGTVHEEPPAWMYAEDDSYRGSVYLMLGDDVALVLCRPRGQRPWVVVTVMTRHDVGGIHAATLRARRKARHAALHPPPRAGNVLPPRTYDDGLYEL